MAPANVILVAEDNDDDFVLLRCAFESAQMPHKLIGVANGLEAIDYLYADEPYTNRSVYPFPDLMLLDLQMPVMDGFEVLAALKGQRPFRCLPIVVVSSVDDPRFIQQALNFGATDFWIKPIGMEDRIKMVRKLQSRWLKVEYEPPSGPRIFNPWSLRVPQDVPEPKKKS